VQNAIDPAGFAEVERADLKKRFGFPDDSIVCISGGRFSKEKGQSYLVDAARTASEQNPRLRFVIFGDGPDLEKINSRVEELGLSETVLCPGFERDLLGYLKDADMLVNPSLSEGLPNIVLEAMALKIPVVATSVGGVPELVEDGVSGFLVPPADSNLLADKILQLAGRKDIQEKFAREGYRTIVEKFSFDSQAEKLYRVYREALKRD
jgi:glycosyltransferase involved in cell wall biosynthesis